MVCRRGGRADARPLLKSLHWLPLNQRITYKVAVLTYKLRSTSTPPYLSTLLQPVTSSRSLRSVDSFRLQVQRTRSDDCSRTQLSPSQAGHVQDVTIGTIISSTIWSLKMARSDKSHMSSYSSSTLTMAILCRFGYKASYWFTTLDQSSIPKPYIGRKWYGISVGILP